MAFEWAEMILRVDLEMSGLWMISDGWKRVSSAGRRVVKWELGNWVV